jgi:hypothetical protein
LLGVLASARCSTGYCACRVAWAIPIPRRANLVHHLEHREGNTSGDLVRIEIDGVGQIENRFV